jgi:PKD repeat protein
VSRYNLVVRPQQDSVDISGGSGTLTIYVQNNMGYPLVNFALEAYASDADIAISPAAPKVTNAPTTGDSGSTYDVHYLLPGESQRHILNITRTGSSATLAAEEIKFYVRFDHPDDDSGSRNDQSDRYGDNGSSPSSSNPPGRAVIIKKTTGEIAPASPSFNGDSVSSQARHIVSSSWVDFGDASEEVDGLNHLFQGYCAGRGSYATDNTLSPITSCTGSRNCCAESGGDPATFDAGHCQISGSGSTSKYAWQHLWAAGEIAYRKSHSHVAGHLDIFRERLMCGSDDNHLAFRGFPTFILGYLGADADVQAFLATQAGSGTTSDSAELMARAALFMLTDGASNRSDIEHCLSGSITEHYARMTCAAALRYVDGSTADSTVQTELIERVCWGGRPPERSTETAEGLYAAHLLNLLAWEERGWSRLADDMGGVSFYSVVVDDVPPAAPTGLRCIIGGTLTDPSLRISWDTVLDQDGSTETMGTYTVYRGSAARDAGCTDPMDAACHFTHNDTTDRTYFDPSGLTAGQTYHFTVRATDAAGNVGAWSTPADFSCVAPTPASPPTAVLECSTTPDPPTLDSSSATEVVVTCNCLASTDDGTISCFFNLDGTEQQTASETGTESWNFTSVGEHTIGLRVVDDDGLEGIADQESVVIANGTIQPPTAVVTPATATCSPGDILAFDGSGSSDSDGTIESYAWTFSDDGFTTVGTSASHECDSADFTATLVVTDDDGATGTDFAHVTVDVNEGPNLALVEVGPNPVPTHTDVTGDATGASDPDGIASYAWSFGDGFTSDQRVATHAYTAEGVYEVTLVVTDAATPPASSTDTWAIAVTNTENGSPSCTAATVSPDSGHPPLTVTLNGSGCDDPDGDDLTFAWLVDRGAATYDTANTQHTFETGGSHTVTLTVTDDGLPPMQSPTREFTILVGSHERQIVGGSCTAQPTTPVALLGIAGILVGWRRQRRR